MLTWTEIETRAVAFQNRWKGCFGDEKQDGQTFEKVHERYPDASLADLYDELTMPPDLRKAHQANDKAVWEAYAKPWHPLDNEPACVAYLMELYEQITNLPD